MKVIGLALFPRARCACCGTRHFTLGAPCRRAWKSSRSTPPRSPSTATSTTRWAALAAALAPERGEDRVAPLQWCATTAQQAPTAVVRLGGLKAGLVLAASRAPDPPTPPRPSLQAVVKLADNFNGADLRNICTEAGMFAIRDERDYVIQVGQPSQVGAARSCSSQGCLTDDVCQLLRGTRLVLFARSLDGLPTATHPSPAASTHSQLCPVAQLAF